jgi:hypothetical protein
LNIVYDSIVLAPVIVPMSQNKVDAKATSVALGCRNNTKMIGAHGIGEETKRVNCATVTR